MLVYKNHNLITIGVAGAVKGRFSTLILKSTRITVFTTVYNEFIQPRTQVLSTTRLAGGKTLVQAGHVSPRFWEIT
jgi:hypothetical protein